MTEKRRCHKVSNMILLALKYKTNVDNVFFKQSSLSEVETNFVTFANVLNNKLISQKGVNNYF